MQVTDKDIWISLCLAYKELRRLGDVMQVPLRDQDCELLRDETLKIIKAAHLATAKYRQVTAVPNQLMKK